MAQKYSWQSYRKSANYKADKERIFNSNASLDRFDRNIEESERVSYKKLSTPFNV